MNIKLVLSAVAVGFAAAGADAGPERIPLWEGPAPVGGGKTEATSKAAIHVHHPAKPNGTAVVICPGGGYGGKVMGGEGHGIARWLNSHGITGIVLDYRLPKGRCEVPLLDAQRAIRIVRSHATKWKINPKRIGIIGFSAGGHLAATATVHHDNGTATAEDPIDRISCRPDFAILIYPVISMEDDLTHKGSRRNLLGKRFTPEQVKWYSPQLNVTKTTPPTFLAHALDDRVVPIGNSRAFEKAAQAKKVPCRLLELPNGGHGLNGYKGPSWDAWQKESLIWLGKVLPVTSDR